MAYIGGIWASWELDFLEKHLKTVNASLLRELKDHEATMQERLDREGQECHEQFSAMMLEHSQHLAEEFPAFSTNMLFVALCTFFEDQLTTACDYLHRKKNLPLRFKDLAGDTLDQCKKYLDRLCEIRVADFAKAEWPEIRSFQKIRNVIIHQRGHLPLDKIDDARINEVRKYLETHPGQVSQFYRIALKERFCLDAITVVRRFTDKLHEAIERTMQDDPE